MIHKLSTLLLIAVLFISQTVFARVRPGIEVLLRDSLAVVNGKRVGLVTNQTGIDHLGNSSIDLLYGKPEVSLVRLFAPEHGIDGTGLAGERIENAVHESTGLVVTSLYHGARLIDPALLSGLDQILFDIQDIGIRPYTYVSTLAEVMKAARSANIEVIVLDRPNPLGGQLVSGLMLEPEWASFIGPYPVPYVHGMTVGELALLFNSEFGIDCRLRVIPVAGWSRNMSFPETGLPWVPTSPNVPTWDTAYGMAVTGALGELGTVAEAVGTASPFFMVGHPKLNARDLANRLNGLGADGVRFIPWTFRPTSGRWVDQRCHGVRILVLDPECFDPGKMQLELCRVLADNSQLGADLFTCPSQRTTMFDRAMGSDRPRLALQGGAGVASLLKTMKQDCITFRDTRSRFLLYREEP